MDIDIFDITSRESILEELSGELTLDDLKVLLRLRAFASLGDVLKAVADL